MKTIISITAIAVLAYAGFSTAASQSQTELNSLIKEQWRQDLRYLAVELPRRHKNAFHTISRQQFEKASAELDAQIPLLDGVATAVAMSKLVAQIGDAHTYVHVPLWPRYPLNLAWFGGELRVVRISSEHRRALGASVVAIGDIDIAEANRRARAMLTQGENESFLQLNATGLLAHPPSLRALGLAASLDAARYAFRADSGETFMIEFNPVAENEKVSWVLPFQVTPLRSSRPGAPRWFTPVGEGKTLYVNFNSYDDLPKRAQDLFEYLDKHSVERLVIDLRQNRGGDYKKGHKHIIEPILRRAALNRRGRLYVVTGPATFSAAMANACQFRRETNALLVGQAPGERPNSYQEKREMRLPNSHLVVSYSVEYYKFLDEDVPALIPDEIIESNWASFRAGKDAALDWILAQPLDSTK